MAINSAIVRQTILNQVRSRGSGKSICPSEVARAIGGDEWRSLMPLVRQVGAELVNAGEIIATQKGQEIDPLTAKGPLRFKLPEDNGEGKAGRQSAG